MIQQIHIAPYPTPEVPTGKKITMPGQAVDIKQVIEMYSRGTMEERARGFYEQEGMPIPDFERMSKIERLEKLAEYHKQIVEASKNIEQAKTASAAKAKDAILQKTVNQKVEDELKKRKSSTSGGHEGKD